MFTANDHRFGARPGGGLRPILSRRSATALAALVAGSLLTGPARAAHVVEFQLDVAKLFTLVGDRIAEEEICYADPIQIPGLAGSLVLDHVEFPGPIQLQKSGQQLQVVVPVAVYTKAAACLTDPNCGPTDYTPPFPYTTNLVLDLTAEFNSNGELTLCVTAPTGGVLASLGGLGDDICSEIDLEDSLVDLLGSVPNIKQVGLSANAALDRIAVRIEFDNPANPTAPPASSWTDFFNGQLAPTGPNMDWSMFITKHLMLDVFKDRFAGQLTVIEGPGASWFGLGVNGGLVQVTFTADFDVSVCPNTIAADVIVSTILSVDANDPNVLKLNGSLDTDIWDSDVFLCALSIGGFGNPEVFSVILAVSAVIAANQGPGGGNLPAQCSLNEDDGTFACSNPVDLTPIRMSKYNTPAATRGILVMDALFGDPAGPVMGGPIDIWLAPPANPKKLLEVGPGEITYGLTGSCNSIRLGYSGAIPVTGDGMLCQPIQVIDDPLNVFKITWPGSHWLGSNYIGAQVLEIGFFAGSDLNAYFANPYPCRVVIRSSVGLRCYEIAAPSPPPAEGSVEELMWLGALEKEEIDCLKLVHYLPKKMEFLWLIDPPPFQLPYHVQFAERLVRPAEFIPMLTNVNVVFNQPIEAQQMPGGQIQAAGAIMTLQADVFVQAAGAAAGAGATGALALPLTSAKPKSTAAAKQASAAAARLADGQTFTIEQTVTLDLIGELQGDGTARFKPAGDLTQVFRLGADQLPAGVRELLFVVELPAERWEMHGEVEQLEPSIDPAVPTVAPNTNGVCGDGVCGLGTGGAVPFAAFGMLAMRSDVRRRRRRF